MVDVGKFHIIGTIERGCLIWTGDGIKSSLLHPSAACAQAGVMGDQSCAAGTSEPSMVCNVSTCDDRWPVSPGQHAIHMYVPMDGCMDGWMDWCMHACMYGYALRGNILDALRTTLVRDRSLEQTKNITLVVVFSIWEKFRHGKWPLK